MITPGLLRRSFRQALQWRFLLLWLAALAIPAAAALFPLARFLDAQLGHHPRAKELVAALDSHALSDLLRQTFDPAFSAAMQPGFSLAAILALFAAPLAAAAALALARADEPPRLRGLLAGAGEYYGRMLRTMIVAAIPLGIAGTGAAAISKLAGRAARHAITEGQAARFSRIAAVAIFLLIFVAQLTLDAGRAHFAAEPQRRSAFLAWWSGVRLLVRQPLRGLGLGLLTLVVGGGLAALLLLVRLRVHQTGLATVLLALVLAELAAASIGWERATRLVGLAELVRADAADRQRKAFTMLPPTTSPPPGEPAP